MALATLTGSFSPPPPSPAGDIDPAAQPPTDTEATLRLAAASGDGSAFAALYARYREPVYQFLLRRCRGDRHLAEDLTQDAFIRALKGIGRYREMGRPFGAWLVTIAGNLLADHFKSSWHRFQVPWHDFTGDGADGWLLSRQPVEEDPAAEVSHRDGRRYTARLVAQAVDQLTPRQRQVIALRYAEGLSVSDTADRLGLERGAVKAASYRARQTLAGDPRLGGLRLGELR